MWICTSTRYEDVRRVAVQRPFLTETLDGGEWSIAQADRWNCGERASGTHWRRGWVAVSRRFGHLQWLSVYRLNKLIDKWRVCIGDVGISEYLQESAVGGTELFTMMACSRCTVSSYATFAKAHLRKLSLCFLLHILSS